MQDQYNTKPSLEAQIQSMLNQVMDDDEITNDHEDGLEFSEESEDESSSQYIEYNPNQFNPYTNFFTRSHPLKTKTTNPPYYETLPQQNHRNYKKYQTVSFYQTNQPYPLRIPITNTKPVYYPPQMTYTQFPSPEPKVFKRSDKRKTYYTMKGNQPKIQNINNNDIISGLSINGINIELLGYGIDTDKLQEKLLKLYPSKESRNNLEKNQLIEICNKLAFHLFVFFACQ